MIVDDDWGARRLALAVLALAATEARMGRGIERRMARRWLLRRSHALGFWCAIAQIHPDEIKRAFA